VHVKAQVDSVSTHDSSEDDMAKGQMRSNREKKKPKADKSKKKGAPATSSFSLERQNEKGGGKKF
jgi:hypothetical protein